MRVVKIVAMDVNRYFENLKKGLYDEVKKHQKNLRYEDIQEGFCFEDSYGTLCCLRRCDNQSIFQMEKQYPGMIQILVHKIEPFDEKYRVLYYKKSPIQLFVISWFMHGEPEHHRHVLP